MTPTPFISRPQPEPIKMIVELPPLAHLTAQEAAIAGADLVQRVAERVSERVVEAIQEYYA